MELYCTSPVILVSWILLPPSLRQTTGSNHSLHCVASRNTHCQRREKLKALFVQPCLCPPLLLCEIFAAAWLRVCLCVCVRYRHSAADGPMCVVCMQACTLSVTHSSHTHSTTHECMAPRGIFQKRYTVFITCILKMEAIYCPEMSVPSNETTLS
jgi:hypothetical protein